MSEFNFDNENPIDSEKLAQSNQMLREFTNNSSEVPVSSSSVNNSNPSFPVHKPIYGVDTTKHFFSNVEHGNDKQSTSESFSPKEKKSRFWSWFSEGFLFGRDLVFATFFASLIIFFVVRPVKVEGTSMLPRLHDGERIFINEFVYKFKPIERGDIVVFWYPKDPEKSFIKRVIGLPADEVQLSDGKLYINGKLISEPYLSKNYTTLPGPSRTWVVEPHHYFVMGDNRDASNDSRSWGLVPEKYIYGKAIYRYWPLEEAGSISDNSTILKSLKELSKNPSANDE